MFGCNTLDPTRILGYITINQLLIKMIITTENTFSRQSLTKIEQNINSMIENRSIQSPPLSISTKINNNKTKLFPLLELPNDVISATALFLNEKDIFNFERCCRLFYQLIDNSSYLNKCNNYKTFEITNEMVDQIISSKYNYGFHKCGRFFQIGKKCCI